MKITNRTSALVLAAIVFGGVACSAPNGNNRSIDTGAEFANAWGDLSKEERADICEYYVFLGHEGTVNFYTTDNTPEKITMARQIASFLRSECA